MIFLLEYNVQYQLKMVFLPEEYVQDFQLKMVFMVEHH
jgi:hypothetical protein